MISPFYNGFNPYFSGCFSLSGDQRRRNGIQRRRFQSLFFWMLLSKTSDFPCLGGMLTSFNPYFSGCFSLRRQLGYDPLGLWVLFQSLFFWMLLSKWSILVDDDDTITLFQSLFFWMLLSKKNYNVDGV